MYIKDGRVHFKSMLEMYDVEVSGDKNNTVRILTQEEYTQFCSLEPKEIVITDLEAVQSFTRTITNVTHIGGLLGFHVIDFSWAREKHE